MPNVGGTKNSNKQSNDRQVIWNNKMQEKLLWKQIYVKMISSKF